MLWFNNVLSSSYALFCTISICWLANINQGMKGTVTLVLKGKPNRVKVCYIGKKKIKKKSRHPGSKDISWNKTKEIFSVLNFLSNFALSLPCETSLLWNCFWSKIWFTFSKQMDIANNFLVISILLPRMQNTWELVSELGIFSFLSHNSAIWFVLEKLSWLISLV